jgi:hypothetical protein
VGNGAMGDDEGTDDDAICALETGGAVVATCRFTDGSIA